MKPPAFCRLKFSTRTTAASLCLILLSAAPCLNAQPKAPPQTQPASPFFDATNLRDTADLTSADWLVHAGDDPAYARPDFDDTHWTPFNPQNSLKTIFPNHPEILWYRLRIKVPPGETGLSLETYKISPAFEIYVNGQRILQSGQVSPFKGYTSTARVQIRIPDAQVATGTILLAQRVHFSSLDWSQLYPGGSSPRLGQEDALREHIWLITITQNLFNWMNQFAGLGLGFVALALFVSQRRHREYLWIFLSSISSGLQLPLNVYQLFHDVPLAWATANALLGVVATVFLTLMYFAFLRIPFGRGMQAFSAVAVLSYAFASIGITIGSLGLVAVYLAIVPMVLLVAGVIPVLLIIHFRRGNREAGILLIPVILYSLDLYIQITLGLFGSVPAFGPAVDRANNALQSLHAGPFLLQLSAIGDLLYVLTLAIIIVLRSTRISRQQAELESEIAAAREVQQVLVPETISALPGFTLTSAYRPAQEVGGDFFQIIPLESGSTLVVLGDVSGKGLKAAMAVSLIVGAIRTVAETTSSPSEILACLNRRLYGRLNGGFSTAIAMRLDADGACTLASAGHPEPFLNDREIEMPGALPLGVEPAVSYAEHSFMLGPADRLALYTDGLLEARNASGELFSFHRLKTLFAANPSAAQATDAAVDFGQEDDITVLTLTRLAVGERSTAHYTAPTFAPA